MKRLLCLLLALLAALAAGTASAAPRRPATVRSRYNSIAAARRSLSTEVGPRSRRAGPPAATRAITPSKWPPARRSTSAWAKAARRIRPRCGTFPRRRWARPRRPTSSRTAGCSASRRTRAARRQPAEDQTVRREIAGGRPAQLLAADRDRGERGGRGAEGGGRPHLFRAQGRRPLRARATMRCCASPCGSRARRRREATPIWKRGRGSFTALSRTTKIPPSGRGSPR